MQCLDLESAGAKIRATFTYDAGSDTALQLKFLNVRLLLASLSPFRDDDHERITMPAREKNMHFQVVCFPLRNRVKIYAVVFVSTDYLSGSIYLIISYFCKFTFLLVCSFSFFQKSRNFFSLQWHYVFSRKSTQLLRKIHKRRSSSDLSSAKLQIISSTWP
jgi:hypothetical protein